MTKEQFWYEEEYLFEAYQKAYYRNLHLTSWVQGQYTLSALNATVGNLFLSKGATPNKYAKTWFDPFKDAELKRNKEAVAKKDMMLSNSIFAFIENGQKEKDEF